MLDCVYDSYFSVLKKNTNSTKWKGKEIIIKQSRADMPETIHSASIFIPPFTPLVYFILVADSSVGFFHFYVNIWVSVGCSDSDM